MEQELEDWRKEYENCGAIILEIHKLEDNEPDNRKIKELNAWKEKMNFLILQYNSKTGEKIFKKL